MTLTPKAIQKILSQEGVDLGNKFSAEFGVTPDPKYDSYRPPKPEVVEAMIDSWQQYAKNRRRFSVYGSVRTREF